MRSIIVLLMLSGGVLAQQPILWQNSGTTKIKPSPSKIITTDKQIESTLTTGTAPFAVTSTTRVDNLNVEKLNSQSGSYYLDLSNMASGTLAVGRGGTGQSSYTNGQLLIGNTTGNTLSLGTLTGTSNQVTVTNGGGSITLSGPQDLASSSSPAFAGMLISTDAGSNPVHRWADGDISHSFTGVGAWGVTTDTAGVVSVTGSTTGGISLVGFSGSDAISAGFSGHINSASPTQPAIVIDGWKTDGGTGRTALTGAEVIARVRAGSTSRVSITGGGAVWIHNGTTPSASVTDVNQIYSADAAAGDSQLWSRNEAGKVERFTGLRKRVSTQFDKTSSTTLSNVTGLSFNVEASGQYAFRAYLFTASDVAGGVKYAIGGTCTATSIRYDGLTVGSTGQITTTRSTALGTAVGGITAVTVAPATIEGLIVVNAAGTLTVQFAQNVSNATASSVLTGSYFELIPIGD